MSLDRYLKTGFGNIKELESFDPPLYRLRLGDWRLIFRELADDSVEVVRVRNRGEAYR